MKTTVEISDPLLRRAKTLARRQGRTLRDLIEAGLRSVLEAERRNESPPFVLRDGSVDGEGLAEGWSYDDWAAIRDASERGARRER